MPANVLVCTGCSRRYPLQQFYKCEDCGGILEVEYDCEGEAFEGPGDDALTGRLAHNFLPIDRATGVGLGEGNTPLISAPAFSRTIGVSDLWLKCESCNPTGSFKDRPISIGVSKAVELGISTAVVASSGNASSAAAAFAARAGMKVMILLPLYYVRQSVHR